MRQSPLVLAIIVSFLSLSHVNADDCRTSNCMAPAPPKAVTTLNEKRCDSADCLQWLPSSRPQAPAVSADRLPSEQKGIAAVARIFELKYFDFSHEIYIRSPITASIDGNVIESVPGDKCTYQIRRKNGAASAQISFGRLSDEYQTIPIDEARTNLVVSGQGPAVCEATTVLPNGSHDEGRCYPFLSISVSPPEAVLALRALRYVFSNVCQSADLPF